MDKNNYEPLRREDMMKPKHNIYQEPARREDMMQPKHNIYQEPARREDMMQADIDINKNTEFIYEEQQNVHRM